MNSLEALGKAIQRAIKELNLGNEATLEVVLNGTLDENAKLRQQVAELEAKLAIVVEALEKLNWGTGTAKKALTKLRSE